MSASLNKVLIRCDAAPEIGFGHVVRCLALADELRDSRGCHVDFAMLQGPQGVAQVQAQGYEVFQPEHGIEVVDEGKWLQELITKCKHQVLILDVRTDLATQAVKSIRESDVVIATIDDPSDRRLHADLAFYPPVPQVERMDWSSFTGKRFVGWNWVLLRPQFAEAPRRSRKNKTKALEQTQAADRPFNLLVSMGGSDPAGLTLMALQAIENIEIDNGVHVIFVIGQGFLHKQVFTERLEAAKRSYEIRHNVTDIASLMIEADVAISSFGVTAYELAAVKVPTVYLCLTEDHAKSASLFHSAGFGISLGTYKNITISKLTQALVEQIDVVRQNSRDNIPTFKVDGLGARRIAQTIFSFLLNEKASC